jgi:putative spermidine/putrescine transport system permease protein
VKRPHWTALKVVVVLVYAFILGPIAITTTVSFNEGNRSMFPPVGFSLKWWGAAFAPQWTGPLLFSLELAAVTAAIAAFTGALLAFALQRYEFRGKAVLRTLALGPLLLPSLITGIALLQFLALVGLVDWLGFPALLIGHVVICMPFCVRTTLVGLEAMPPGLENAAASLGARRSAVLRHVTMPLAMPGVAAGAIFAFVHSFDDVNLSLFVARPGQQPITVAILAFLEYGFAPTLAAVSIVSLLIPLALVALFGKFIGIGNFLYENVGRG